MRRIIVLLVLIALLSSFLCACDMEDLNSTLNENDTGGVDVKTFKFTLNEDGDGYILEKYKKSSDSAKNEVVIPDTYEGLPVVEIGNGAFIGHSSLNSVIIPEGVKIIRCGAFSGCRSLVDITIPRSLITIEDNAFENCSSLIELHIPQPVDIGRSAFEGCSSLKKVSFGLEWGGGFKRPISHSAFKGCSSLEVAKFGPYYCEVSDYAFAGCSNLHELYLSSGLTDVKSQAFQNCKSLDLIYFWGTEEEMNAIFKWSWWEPEPGFTCWEIKPIPEIAPGLSIMDVINSEHAWTSEGGIHNPYDRFYFDCENMLLNYVFESSAKSDSREYKMTIVNEKTVRVEGLRPDFFAPDYDFPVEITIINENRLWVRYIDDDYNTGDYFLNRVIE